jgi:phosphatidylserine/phosphatidylglycerophosphate/cardiolipin synthase-like enzyme
MRRFVLLFSVLLIISLPSPVLAAQARHPQLPDPPGIECRTLPRFSPHGGAAAAISGELARATTRIRAALYGLNHPDLVTALIQAHERGVSVAIKLDKVQSAGKTQKEAIRRLRAAGVSVEVSELSRLLHDKFAVIDGRRVITGSFNWTNPAENRNRENLVILDCKDLPRVYEEEWAQIEIRAPQPKAAPLTLSSNVQPLDFRLDSELTSPSLPT